MMPIYVYRCPACGDTRDVLVQTWEQSDALVNNPPLCFAYNAATDFDCAYAMERQPTAPAIHFKGAGWTPKGT